MSTLILLSRLRVENANAVAGLTWGFPAITHFLGFTHALSRKLTASHGLTLDGCGVVCHDHQLHAHSSGRDYCFALTRNPLTRDGKTAAFNEEGRMHLTVSLLLECHGEILNGEQGRGELEAHLLTLCQTQRLAAGTIFDIGAVTVINSPENDHELNRLRYRLLPGFALLDRSPWLAEHHQALREQKPDATLLDAWLDFAALTQRAEALDDNSDPKEGDPAEWRYQPKPRLGYLVPLMTGYQRVSPLYPAGSVDKVRDPNVPFAWAEAVYGVGEWRAPHRIASLGELFWRYTTTDTGYYCSGTPSADDDAGQDDEDNDE